MKKTLIIVTIFMLMMGIFLGMNKTQAAERAIDNTTESKIIEIKENKDTYTVQITDHGKGIKEEELDKIWDKYYKTDKTHARNQVGTGLGLSIVKGILKNHNFNYGVKSEVGKYTTFYFEIDKAKNS